MKCKNCGCTIQEDGQVLFKHKYELDDMDSSGCVQVVCYCGCEHPEPEVKVAKK